MRARSKIILGLAALGACLVLVGFGLVWWRALPLEETRQVYGSGQYLLAAQLAEQRLAQGDPHDPEAMLLAARAYAQLGRWPEAEAYFCQLPLRDREDLRMRARGLETRQLWTESAMVYEQIVQRWRDDGDALQHLAAIRVQQDRAQEALILSRRLAQIPSYEAIGHVLTGMIEHEMQNQQQAVDEFERALAVSPELKGIPTERWQVLQWFAEALLMLGRSDDAEKYALEARQLSSSAEPCLVLGQARQQMDDDEGARRYWTEAAARNPNFVPALKELAQLCLRQGTLDDALRWCAHAHELEPENPAIKYLLRTIYIRLGQLDKANELSGTSPSNKEGQDRPH